MKMLLKSLLSISVIFMVAVFISGCVNVDQKTKLNADGSGTISLKYWAKSGSFTFSDELGGFAFSEPKVKSNYSSSNTEPSDIKIEKNTTADSLNVVTLNVKFKDINKLSEAKGFAKVKASFIDGKEGKEFKYILLQDSSATKDGMNQYSLTYEFDFPNDVISTNGIKDGSKVKWNKTVADLKEDVVMTATVKAGKKCGLFGMELPIIFLLGMGFIYLRRRK